MTGRFWVSTEDEGAGLGIFDVDSGRARDFARLVGDMQELFNRMIAWHMQRMDESMNPAEMWSEFLDELRGPFPARGSA